MKKFLLIAGLLIALTGCGSNGNGGSTGNPLGSPEIATTGMMYNQAMEASRCLYVVDTLHSADPHALTVTWRWVNTPEKGQ